MTTTTGRPDPVPTTTSPSLTDRLTTELDAELHVLETAWRRPTCTTICAPLAHSLRCDLAHLDQRP